MRSRADISVGNPAPSSSVSFNGKCQAPTGIVHADSGKELEIASEKALPAPLGLADLERARCGLQAMVESYHLPADVATEIKIIIEHLLDLNHGARTSDWFVKSSSAADMEAISVIGADAYLAQTHSTGKSADAKLLCNRLKTLLTKLPEGGLVPSNLMPTLCKNLLFLLDPIKCITVSKYSAACITKECQALEGMGPQRMFLLKMMCQLFLKIARDVTRIDIQPYGLSEILKSRFPHLLPLLSPKGKKARHDKAKPIALSYDATASDPIIDIDSSLDKAKDAGQEFEPSTLALSTGSNAAPAHDFTPSHNIIHSELAEETSSEKLQRAIDVFCVDRETPLAYESTADDVVTPFDFHAVVVEHPAKFAESDDAADLKNVFARVTNEGTDEETRRLAMLSAANFEMMETYCYVPPIASFFPTDSSNALLETIMEEECEDDQESDYFSCTAQMDSIDRDFIVSTPDVEATEGDTLPVACFHSNQNDLSFTAKAEVLTCILDGPLTVLFDADPIEQQALDEERELRSSFEAELTDSVNERFKTILVTPVDKCDDDFDSITIDGSEVSVVTTSMDLFASAAEMSTKADWTAKIFYRAMKTLEWMQNKIHYVMSFMRHCCKRIASRFASVFGMKRRDGFEILVAEN